MTAARPVPSFPGGTALTRLRPYQDEGADGCPGGTPHLHTASSEAYLVVAGTGQVETLNATGYAVHELLLGELLWFSPGTIHRIISGPGLELLVIMQNAGLPENGDAIMTFDAETLDDASRYAQAATLPSGGAGEAAARARRDAALRGYAVLKEAALAGDLAPLTRFHAQAVALIAHRVPHWRALWEETVVAQVTATRQWLTDLEHGTAPHFADAAVARAQPTGPAPRYGMCGLLQHWKPGVATSGETASPTP